MFWQWSVLPLIPAALKAAVRRFLPRQPPSWISREFASSINLQQRMARKRSGLRYASIAQQKIHELLDWGSLSLGFDLCGRDDGRLGMERRQPFNDRRLIEFALAIPEEQRWRGDMTKFVLRQAMREYLPHRIVQRRSKADFTFGIADSVTREIAGKDPASFNLAKAGFIDAKEVGNLQRRWSGGEVDLSWRLWMILALEQWFDTVFSAPSGRFAQSVIRE